MIFQTRASTLAALIAADTQPRSSQSKSVDIQSQRSSCVENIVNHSDQATHARETILPRTGNDRTFIQNPNHYTETT